MKINSQLVFYLFKWDHESLSELMLRGMQRTVDVMWESDHVEWERYTNVNKTGDVDKTRRLCDE